MKDKPNTSVDGIGLHPALPQPCLRDGIIALGRRILDLLPHSTVWIFLEVMTSSDISVENAAVGQSRPLRSHKRESGSLDSVSGASTVKQLGLTFWK
jgi:hypothetical protein